MDAQFENLISTILTTNNIEFVIAVVTALLTVHFAIVSRRRKAELARNERQIKDNAGDIERLREIIKDRNLELSALENELRTRVPDRVLSKALNAYAAGDRPGLKAVLDDWRSHAGRAISELFLLQCRSAFSMAAGEARSAGLSVAQAYAEAAAVLHPGGMAKALSEELTHWREYEGHPSVPISKAFRLLEEYGSESGHFDLEQLFDAIRATIDARPMVIAGDYERASALVEEAIGVLDQHLGSAIQTLIARSERASILVGRGRWSEAIAECDEIIELWNSLDPRHTNHLNLVDTKTTKAQALQCMNRTYEAAVILTELVDRYPLTSESSNSITLRTYLGLASIYSTTGEHEKCIILSERILAVLNNTHDGVSVQGVSTVSMLSKSRGALGCWQLAYAEAVEYLNRVEKNREIPQYNAIVNQLRLQAAITAANVGKLPEAINILDRARREILDNYGENYFLLAQINYARARALSSTGQTMDAINILEKLISRQSSGQYDDEIIVPFARKLLGTLNGSMGESKMKNSCTMNVTLNYQLNSVLKSEPTSPIMLKLDRKSS